MATKFFNLVINADTQSVVTNFNKAQKGMTAFNKQVGAGSNVVGNLTGQIKGLVGAYIGFNAVAGAATIIKNADTAAFNLATSIEAANREYSNTGSAKQWGNSIDELSGKLRIYSKAELKEATAKTIDMTKRLGLSAEQMKKVIEVTGDLSGGKFALADGVERTTAALRGEAEASEALGLTLNENYVKSWYKAQGATKGAWKNLTDIEKAQVRYNVLLEQASSKQGTAANSVTTLGGAIALTKSIISDAVTENQKMVDVSKQLAEYISTNSETIGELAVRVASAASSFIQWSISHADLIITLGKISVLIFGVSKVAGGLVTTIQGVNAASLAMTGIRVLPWLQGLAGGAGAAAVATKVLGIALKATLIGAAVVAILKIGELIKILWDWKVASGEVDEAQAQLSRSQAKLSESFKKVSADLGISITTMDQLSKLETDGIIRMDEATGKWVKNTEAQRLAYKKAMADAATASKVSVAVEKKVATDRGAAYAGFAEEVKKNQDAIIEGEKKVSAAMAASIKEEKEVEDLHEQLHQQYLAREKESNNLRRKSKKSDLIKGEDGVYRQPQSSGASSSFGAADQEVSDIAVRPPKKPIQLEPIEAMEKKRSLAGMAIEKIHKIEIGTAAAYVENDDQAGAVIRQLEELGLRS